MKATFESPCAENSQFTLKKIDVPPTGGATSIKEAEFLRLPPPKGRCPLTGLSRTSLVELIEAGKIKAVRLRKRGALRGITLINKQSLLDYLYGLQK